MTIDLDKETQRLIEQEIQAGRFHDAATFVCAAVRHFLITLRSAPSRVMPRPGALPHAHRPTAAS
jgi:Arc/MetJ-type ribon-helix-helix transcriptional regulator